MAEPDWGSIFSGFRESLENGNVMMKGRPEVQESWQDLEGNSVGVIKVWYVRPKD